MTDAFWSCRRKTRYSSEERARAVAILAHQARGDLLRVYQCQECGGGFHLTHTRVEMNPNWRPAKLSARQEASLRKFERRRYGRSR